MSELKLQLTDSAFKSALEQAILATLTEEAKNKIIAEAVAHLTKKPDKRDYFGGEPKSPLLEAFEQAAQGIMREAAREYVTTNAEFRAKLKDSFEGAIVKLLKDDGALADAMGNALAVALSDIYLRRNE